MYYDTPSQDFFLLQNFQSGGPASPATNPGTGVSSVTFTSGPIPFGPGVSIFGGGAAASGPTPIFAVDLNLRTPYIQNYNLNVQQELRPGMVVQVGYVGSQGRKLFRLRDINQASPAPPPPAGTPASVAAAMLQSRRPLNAQFPQLSFI